MTSLLHKKHPTTQQNTRQQIRSSWRWLRQSVLTAVAVCSLVTFAIAEENFLPFEQPTSARTLSPLERLKARSAQNRFQQNAPTWQADKEFSIIRPTPDKKTSNTTHMIEVLDVESFRQLPNKRSHDDKWKPTSQPGQSRKMTFHHVFDKQQKNPARQLSQQPVRQKRRRVFTYEEEPTEQIEMNSPNDLKKISEILPYHDYNGGKSNADQNNELPKELPLSKENYAGRSHADTFFHWEASNIGYHPLYFEDVQLERYGHTYPEYIQPLVSATRFGTQLVGLPYQMGLNSPRKLTSPLGYFNPGEAAPKLFYQIPLSAKAAAIQAGTVTGLIFLVP